LAQGLKPIDIKKETKVERTLRRLRAAEFAELAKREKNTDEYMREKIVKKYEELKILD